SLLHLPLRAPRVHVTPRHVHPVLAELHRERRERRPRLPAVRLAGDTRTRARLLRLLPRRGRRDPLRAAPPAARDRRTPARLDGRAGRRGGGGPPPPHPARPRPPPPGAPPRPPRPARP